ncbi:MAG: twin-arginine translocase TatA/TatE family subunit [Chthoniobacteraceae bacterium]
MYSLAALNNLFGMDAIWLLLICLLLFGAKKLPELARGMGQAIREFNKAKDELTNEINKPSQPVAELTVQKPADQQEHRPGQPTTAPAPEKTEV